MTGNDRSPSLGHSDTPTECPKSPQIGRVLKINQLDAITDDVIEAAASTLIAS